MVVSEGEPLLVAEPLGRGSLGQAGQVGDQQIQLEQDAPRVGHVVDQQVEGAGHVQHGPGPAAEDDQALRGLEQRFDQQVLDDAGPLVDQHRPEQPDQ